MLFVFIGLFECQASSVGDKIVKKFKTLRNSAAKKAENVRGGITEKIEIFRYGKEASPTYLKKENAAKNKALDERFEKMKREARRPK